MKPLPTIVQPRCVQIVIVREGRWRLFGHRFGPRIEFAVEVTYDSDAGFRYQRCDGRPLGKVAGALKHQLELAQVAVLREFRSMRPPETARLQRSSTTDRAARTPVAAPQAGEPQPPSSASSLTRPTGSFLKPNREIPTDRQRSALKTSLASAVATPVPALEAVPAPGMDDLADDSFAADFGLSAEDAALPEAQPELSPVAQTRASGEIRQRVVTPFRDGFEEESDSTLVVSKTTSSIFRVDRQTATDRIAKLRKAPPTPAEIDPFATDTTADLKPLMDELTTRMRRRRNY